MATARRLCAKAIPSTTVASSRGWLNRKSKTCRIFTRSNSDKRGSDGTEIPRFDWKQVFKQWALGVYVSTPLIAILQGSLVLNDYRVNYSDAPRPLMPARGVTVAVGDETESSSTSQGAQTILPSWILHPFSSSSSQPKDRPLRLLVVGDSLAAGVGVSKSGVPILPESIARALSKELGGRAVYWTCVGTPGVSATQIVKDIEQLEPYDPHPKGRQLDRIVKEFHVRRRRWQERHKHGDDQESSDLEIDDENRGNEEPHDKGIGQWWKQIRKRDELNSDEFLNTTRRFVRDWWIQSNIRMTYRERKQIVEEDISAIKEIVMKPLPRLDDDDDDYYYDFYRENLPAENQKHAGNEQKTDGRHEKEQRRPLVHRGTLFRRSSINPKAAAEYDVAVVLTGLNDVKEAFMPHMNRGGGTNAGRLESSLRQVLEALRDKMGGNMNLEESHNGSDDSSPVRYVQDPSNSETKKQRENIRHPLVVVPELPVAPLQIFRLVPLCWFLVPIFRAMENNKRFLASCFPDNVVFVHQPDLHWWTDDEMGIGSIRENIENEQLLLRVTDSVRSGREQIEQLMKKYYDSKEEEIASQRNKYNQNQSPQGSFSTETTTNAYADTNGNSRNGSNLVSVDKMHPNDEGYELWGRHIAAAIIEHWKKDAST